MAQDIFYIAIGLVIATLFLLGAIKSKLTGTSWIKSGVSSVLFGSIGAIVGWAISYGINTGTGAQID